MSDIMIPATQWRPVDITRDMLEGREARCPHCKKTQPSVDFARLACFEYRGPGNGRYCDRCSWAPTVHEDPDVQRRPHVARSWFAHEFTDAEGRQFDSYYCGCRGWD